MTLPATAWLAALSIIATACKEKVSYEGPDLAGSRAAFGCDKSPSGDAADACRMLTEFESAGMVSTWPDADKHTWWGREHCTDTLDKKDGMTFGWLHVMPGAGDTPSLPEHEHEPSRTLPHHAELPTMAIGSATKATLEGYRRMLDAVAKGVEPNFEGIDAFDRQGLEDAWKQIKQFAVANPPKMRLTKATDDKTVLATNATVGSTEMPRAYHNFRQKGVRLYQLKPSKQAHCISELYRVK